MFANGSGCAIAIQPRSRGDPIAPSIRRIQHQCQFLCLRLRLPLRLRFDNGASIPSLLRCPPTAVPPPPMTRQRNSVFLPPWLSASRKCASGCHVPPYLYLRVHGTLFCTPAVTGSRLQDPEPVYTSLTLAWLRHPIAFQVPSLPISLPGHTTLSLSRLSFPTSTSSPRSSPAYSPRSSPFPRRTTAGDLSGKLLQITFL